MKILPSIQYLSSKVKESFLRFPLTILSSIFSACIAIYTIDNGNLSFINLILTTALGIPLYFCVSMYIAKQSLNLKLKIVCQAIASAFLILIYFSFPNSEEAQGFTSFYIRYTIFNIAIHLLVSLLPYIKNNNSNGFWNYNKVLFIQLCTAALYSIFLYLGIVLALFSLDTLFSIDIPPKFYFKVFIFIIGFFNVWFFVAGIPKELNKLNDIHEYPKGIKIFTQYISLPLLTLYLLILYIYVGKIIINWDWPKGIVSYLIFFVSIIGIFTLLLMSPYGNLKGNLWIKKITRIFYFSLFPLVIVLLIAIGLRIDDYGMTIRRNIILLMGIWLIMVSLYFVIGKTNIKFVPVSLIVTLILMSFGSWSIFSVSESNQVNRLTKILKDNSIIINNQIQNEVIWEKDSLPELYSEQKYTNRILNDSIHNEVVSISRYLSDYHSLSSLNPLFKQNIDSLVTIVIDEKQRVNISKIYMNTMGLENWPQHSKQSEDLTYAMISEDIIPISGYDYLFDINTYRSEKSFVLDNIKYTLVYDLKNKNTITLKSENDTVIFDLNPMIERLKNEYDTEKEYISNIEEDKMTFHSASEKFKKIKFEILQIRLKKTENPIVIDFVNSRLFLKE